MLAKGLNFVISPQQLPVVNIIAGTESAIMSNKLILVKAEQLKMKVSAALTRANIPPSNTTIEERKAMTTLNKDNSLTIISADKGSTVVLN